MIQLFMSRSGSSVIVPLNLPASHGAMTEAYSQLEQAMLAFTASSLLGFVNSFLR